MPLFSPKIESFGIDLSDRSVKVSQIKRRGKKLFLFSLGDQFFQEGIIKDGIINTERERDLIQIVKATISKAKGKRIKTKNAICSLPEENAFIKTIRIPRVREEEIRGSVELQIESNFPVKLDNVYFDFELIGHPKAPEKIKKKDNRDTSSKKNFLDVSIAVLPKDVVDSYLSIYQKAGIQPIAFEIESMAVARNLIDGSFTSKPVMILDMGKDGVGVTVFSGKTIIFTSHIGISGNDLDKAIARSLKVKVKEAEKLKKEIGLLSIKKTRKGTKKEMTSFPRIKVYKVPVSGGSNSRNKNGAKKRSLSSKIDFSNLEKADQIFEALVPILTDLAEQVTNHINYLKNLTGANYAFNGGIEKVIICGGGANLVGIADFMSSSLKLPTEIGNPFTNISSDKMAEKVLGKNFQRKSLVYATVLGLAMRGVE